jgi:predicted amidophosphoribosyltransferase
LAESYRNILVPVPPSGPGVCATCHRDVSGPHRRCYRCKAHRETAADLLADIVVPISMAFAGEQFADDLRQYKRSPRDAVRKEKQRRLAAVLANHLRAHERCVATACGVPRFDVVTSVPSTKGLDPHPLSTMLSRTIGQTSQRYRDLLRVGADRGDRVFDPARFDTDDDLAGLRVLLVDDTWTTGANAQSAAARLRLAGAERVAVVVLGRRFDADHPTASSYVAQARESLFDWFTCCLDQSPHGGF